MLGTARRGAGLFGVAVLAAAGLTGCGAEESPAGKAGDVLSLRAITAEGSGLTNYPDVNAGAQAAVEAINAAGGVDGRMIEYSFCDTRGDANQAMVCAREAVEDGVDAIVGRVDIFTTQSTPILEAAGIPDIGAVPIAEIDYQSPVSYPLHAGNYGTFAAAPHAFRAAGKQRMVVVAVDFAATLAQAEMVAEVAEAAGIDNAGIIKVPAQGVTDYAPYAQQIKDHGADAALVLLGPQGLQSLFKAVETLGVRTQLAGTVFSFGESEARAVGSAADDIWVISPFGSPRDTDQEGIEQFDADLAAAGIAEDDLALRRSAGLNAWLAVHAAAEVARGIEGEVTAAAMTEALQEARDVDVAGVLTWNPADLGSADLGAFPRFPASDYQVLTFQDGRLVATDLETITDPLGEIR